MFLADPIGIGASYSSSSYTPTSTYLTSNVYHREPDTLRSMYSNGTYHSSSLARPLPVGPEKRYEYSGGSLGRRAFESNSGKPPLPDYRSSSGMYRSSNSAYGSHYKPSSNWYDTTYAVGRIPRSSSVDRFRLRKYDADERGEEERYRPVSRDTVNSLASRFERSVLDRETAGRDPGGRGTSPLFQKRAPVVRFADETDYGTGSAHTINGRSRVIPIHLENGDDSGYRSSSRSSLESRSYYKNVDTESRDELADLPKSLTNGLYRTRDGASSMPDVPCISSLSSRKLPSSPEVTTALSRGIRNRSSGSSQESDDSRYGRKSSDTKDNGGLRGLANLGNTCFMNSMLQCLSNTSPLVEYVLQNRDNNNNTSKMKGQLFRAFSDLMQHLWKRDNNGTYLSPENLKSQIQKFAPRFSGYNQQDSQEFLRYILQGLHEDINRVQGKVAALPLIDDTLSESQKSDEAWRRYLRYDDSKIVDLFVGQYKSELRCTHCGHISTTFDPFWDLSLPIPSSVRRGGGVTLAECFDIFTKEEILDGNERPKCDKCNAHRRCGKRITIHRFPQILVLHLKRFSGERFRSRLSTLVDFPLNGLDLKPYASPKSNALGALYNCYAVSNHIGTQTMGHYTAYAKHAKTGNWYLYDDSRVSPADERSVISSDAYVLFYESANVSSL